MVVAVVAAILAGDRVNGVGAGVIAGVALAVYLRWSAVARFNAENAELVVRWRALPRSQRRTLRRAVRGGGSIPPEHAALLGDQIAAVEGVWRQQSENAGQDRALPQIVGGIATTCLAGAMAAFTSGGDRVGTVIGFAACGFSVTVWAGFAAALVQRRRWVRRWPPGRLRELRAELEAMPYPRD